MHTDNDTNSHRAAQSVVVAGGQWRLCCCFRFRYFGVLTMSTEYGLKSDKAASNRGRGTSSGSSKQERIGAKWLTGALSSRNGMLLLFPFLYICI